VYIHLQRQVQKKAEVKEGMFYTGKTSIGQNRYRCENKVTTCPLGISTLDWQVYLRELAYAHYNFDTVKMAVVGGDGATTTGWFCQGRHSPSKTTDWNLYLSWCS